MLLLSIILFIAVTGCSRFTGQSEVQCNDTDTVQYRHEYLPFMAFTATVLLVLVTLPFVITPSVRHCSAAA